MRYAWCFSALALSLATAGEHPRPIPPDDKLFTKDTEKPYVLAPGSAPSFGGPVPRDNWHCLYVEGRRSFWKKTDVKFSRLSPKNDPETEYISAKDGRGTEAVFCAANLPKPSKVSTDFVEAGEGVLNAFDLTLRHAASGEYSRLRKSRDTSSQGVQFDRISLEYKYQVLVLDSSGGNDLSWAGELNGDGHPDFFLTSFNREVCSEFQLHLSQPGMLLAYRKLGGSFSCGY